MENAEHLSTLSERGQSSDWLFAAVGTDAKGGVPASEASIRARKACFGTNQKDPKEPPSFCSLFIEGLDDFVLKILMVSAVLSIGLEVGLAAP
jgi:hypothetical protein